MFTESLPQICHIVDAAITRPEWASSLCTLCIH